LPGANKVSLTGVVQSANSNKLRMRDRELHSRRPWIKPSRATARFTDGGTRRSGTAGRVASWSRTAGRRRHQQAAGATLMVALLLKQRIWTRQPPHS